MTFARVVHRIVQTSGPPKTTGLIESGKKRQSRRQRGNRVGKPVRAAIRQFSTRYAAVSTDLSLLFLQRLPAWRFSSTFIQLTRMVIYRHASARRRSFKKLVKSASARVSAGLRPFDGILSILQNHPGEQYSSHWLAALELQAGTAPLHRRGICEPLAL
jgi:hypothetical protein